MSKVFIVSIFILTLPVEACAKDCKITYTQEQLDELFVMDIDANYIPEFDLGFGETLNTSKICKYLYSGPEVEKIISSFTFITAEKYHFLSCSAGELTEVKTRPKFQVGYNVKLKDGSCWPEYNPLNLSTYIIEINNTNNEILKLYRTVG